jgi:hypothetical protein
VKIVPAWDVEKHAEIRYGNQIRGKGTQLGNNFTSMHDGPVWLDPLIFINTTDDDLSIRVKIEVPG